MKKDSRRSQRVADLVRAELSRLVLIEAHDPDLQGRDDHGRRDAGGPEVGPRLLLLPRQRTRPASGRPRPCGAPRATCAARSARGCGLRYAPELFFLSDRLARARRAHRGAAPRRSCDPRRRTRKTSRDPASPARLPDALRRGFLFLIDKPEGLTSHDVVERVRKATAVPAHRAQRHSRSDGDGSAAALRRRRGAPAGLLHADGQVLRGHHPAGPSDDDVRPRGRARSAPTATHAHVTAEDGRGGGRTPSAASSSSPRRPTRPRRSADASSTRWRARARASRRCRRRSGSRASTFGDAGERRGSTFSIACSSGTYIRSIASELGERLGCGAHLETLRRNAHRRLPGLRRGCLWTASRG